MPTIDPAPATSASSTTDEPQQPSAPSPAPSEAAANTDSGAPAGDAAPPAVASRFDVSIGGVAQQVSRMRAVYMPNEHRIGVVAHVRASSEVPEGDLIVFLSKTASGDVQSPDAYVFFDEPTKGERYSPGASSVVTGVSIGAVGAPVSGTFSGELSSGKHDKLDVSFSFSVVRESDSELL